jgi:hypothetical protein
VTPPSTRVAVTLTVGDVKAPTGLVSSNVITYAVPFDKPPAATVSVSIPLESQSPDDPSKPDDDAPIGRDPVTVADPASPEIVTIDPAVAWCVVDVSVTEIVLVALGIGVLCPMALTLKRGSTTSSGR